MKGEFYKMEHDAWDEGTVELSLEEEAAYLRLCHQMYRRHGPIPNSDKLLSVLWRCHINKARPLLKRLIEARKITVTPDGRLANERVTQELHLRETLSTHRAHAGHTGGIRSGHARRKSLKNKEQDEAKRSREEERRGEERIEEKKEGTPTKEKPDEVVQAIESYNATADRVGWSKASKITEPRRSKLKARLAETEGISGWRAALARAEASDFLTGRTGRSNGHEHWSPDLDFLLQPKNFTRLVEGGYDNRGKPPNGTGPPVDAAALERSWFAKLDRACRENGGPLPPHAETGIPDGILDRWRAARNGEAP